MKKTVLIITMLVLSLMFVTGNDKTEARVICTSKALDDLKAKAFTTTLSYELHKTDDGNHYYEVIITNLNENIIAKVEGVVINGGKPGERYSLEKYYLDGHVVVVELYGGAKTACPDQKLTSKRLTLPKYNPYSEREECIEYEEFPMCNPWYKGEIRGDYYFEKELQDYKAKLNPKKEVEKIEEKTIFEKMLDFYEEHIVITVPLTLLIVIGIPTIVIRKIINKKKRVKIDL